MNKFFKNQKILYWIELIVTAIIASAWLKLPFKWMKKYVLQQSFSQKNNYAKVNTLYLLNISEDIPKLEKYFPWQYKCYQQALTARLLLNRRKQASELYLGNQLQDGSVMFHAWCKCRNLTITGFPNIEQYHIIHTFP